MTWKLVARIASTLLAFGLVFVATKYLDGPVPLPGKPSVADLRGEFYAIPIPREHTALEPLSVVDRRAIVAGRTFKSALPPSKVVEYYVAALPALGWKVHSQRAVPVSEPLVLFCKSRLSLALDFVAQQDHSSHYYLGITWTDSSNSDRYCGGPG